MQCSESGAPPASLNTAQGALLTQSAPFASTASANIVTLLTGPPGSPFSLTQTSSFATSGLFSVADPATVGGFYQVNLSDRAPSNNFQGDVISMSVFNCAVPSDRSRLTNRGFGAMAIRNPIEWTADKIGLVGEGRRPALSDAGLTIMPRPAEAPSVRRISAADIWDALAKGWEDVGENRADVLFLCLFYPVIGLVFARVASGYDLLPLVFPLASGFALLGPLAGVGLYEMSRRREQGLRSNWATAFWVARSLSFGNIVLLGILLFAIYMLWLLTAWGIYAGTLGPRPPASIGSFVSDVFTTPAGWTMVIVGIAVGFVYACIVLTLTVVSFPMLIDRNVTVGTAIATSVKVVQMNLVPMAVWGSVVAICLALGSIPLFVGLIVVLPWLGHSTWHLYRKVVST